MDVVIPHLNYEKLRITLEKLRKHTLPEHLRKVILIDQNETYQQVDDLVDIHVRSIKDGKIMNLGFAKACNWGIRLSDAPYVMLLNDDCEAIYKKWTLGIIDTFQRYEKQALCVNPSSPRNPRASGDIPVNHPGWEYKDEFSEEEYDKMVTEIGKGHTIDGICFWGPIFNRVKLDQLKGNVPGVWLDESFWPGGGEDYDMNRRAYMTKNKDNDHRGYRCLGAGNSFMWHWWYSTVSPKTGKTGVKDAGTTYYDKWGIHGEGMPDVYGKTGRQDVSMNKMRDW